MEKECGSWLDHQQHLPWQSANLNSGSMLDVGWQNTVFQPCTTNPGVNMLPSVNEPQLHEFETSELPHLKTSGQSSQQVRGWFYGLPRHRQALTPIPSPVHAKGFCEFPCEWNGNGQVALPKAVLPRSNEEKRFLVFDQSGNQTSLIYSSLIGGSCTQQQQQIFYGNPIVPPPPFDSIRGGSLQQFAKQANELVDQIYETPNIILDGLDENHDTGESEMHEDTEELNALLYSDDDDDEFVGDSNDDDDDEISTGHSPSEMRGEEFKTGEVEEDGEEVASFSGAIRRKRVQNEDDELMLLMETAISTGRRRANTGLKCLKEDDNDGTESSFVGSWTSLSANKNKRLKREKIRETVSILQSIIPTSGKGKDAVLVLDEAIQYLKSLKVKVKSLKETL